jgi:phosphatidylserine/phosphatidylglycerophosphate/cardiolipin synthase-like enzyme
MSDISSDTLNYFVQTYDVALSDEPGSDSTKAARTLAGARVPHTSSGNTVDYLIDGHNYFAAILHEIDALLKGGTDRYFYFANWVVGLVDPPTNLTIDPPILSAWTGAINEPTWTPFRLDDGKAPDPPLFLDKLEAMAKDKVDVRVLAWTSLFTEQKQIKEKAGSIWLVNMYTLKSVSELRERPHLRNSAVINTLAHPFGAMHLKMVVCGDSTRMRAFVSGLDPVSTRIAGWRHPRGEVKDGKVIIPGQLWHDVGARLQGPATSSIYSLFRQLWNEELTREVKTFRINEKPIESYVADTKQAPERLVPSMSTPGTQHVQILRTLPQMHYALFKSDSAAVPTGVPILDPVLNCLARLAGGFRVPALSFAEDGVFEFRVALRKAISHAQTYIYIEDQGFMALEVMQWIHARMNAKPNLKVILLWGADPGDPPNDIIFEAINRHLVPDHTAGLGEPNGRIAFCARGGGITMHGKVTIIDDRWAAVGSANCFRRSLYTDGECSIGVLDEATPSFAQRLRVELWGEHCGLPPNSEEPIYRPREQLVKLDSAMYIWDKTWGWGPWPTTISGSPPETKKIELLPSIQRKNVPFEFAMSPTPPEKWPGSGPPTFDKLEYDRTDADSRLDY